MLNDRDRLRSGLELRTLVLAVAVGILGGLGAVAFRTLAEGAQELFLGEGTLTDAVHALPWWARLAIPTLGALAAALLLGLIGRERQTSGVSDLMADVALRADPNARVGPTLLRALASLGILCTGGSVGREGPILQISASLAAGTGRTLGFTGQRMGLLLGCGVAAGMAAAYDAPVAGALFALELVLANFAIDVFAPVVLASVSATTTLRVVLGHTPVYEIPSGVTAAFLPLEAVWFLLLGVLGGCLASGFLRSLRLGEALFARLPLPRWARLGLGGLLIGVLGLALPEVWGNGFHVVDRILHDGYAPLFVALLCVGKVVATSVSVGSGAPGGVFTPSLFLGACLGLLAGEGLGALLPELTGPVQAYEVVGMAALLAAMTRAPIMAVFVLVEMTADFEMVVPLLLGAVAATATARLLTTDSLYHGRLRRRGVHLPEGIEELALTSTRVNDVMRTDQRVVAPGLDFDALVPPLLEAQRDALYVVDGAQRLQGAIHLHEVKGLLAEGTPGSVVVAADLAREVPMVTPQMSLAQVLDLIDAPGLEELPVVADLGSRRLLGVVARRDVLAALAVEVLKTRSLRAKFVSRDGEGTSYVELPSGHHLARVPVRPDLVDRTIEATGFRRDTGLSILTVVRSDAEDRSRRLLPEPSLVLVADDALVVFGPAERIQAYVGSCPAEPGA